MFTRGIFKRVPLDPGRPDVGVDVLVARLAFGSIKYADWFADCANRVCKYQYEHGCTLSGYYSVVGCVNYYDPDLTAPLDVRVSKMVCDELIPGAHSIMYSSSYIKDVVDILSFVSAVQQLSVHNVRRDLDEIVRETCSDYERIYGNGC